MMNDIQGKRILVTGGAGFIGGHLVSELVRNNASVFVIDITVLPKSIFTLSNLSNKVNFQILDIRDKNKISDYFKKNKFDYVFHLAAESTVSAAYENPHKTFETNIMGTINILEAARGSKEIKTVIVASSDKAYGKTDKAYTEESSLKGDHPYDVSKSSADLICQSYFKTYSTPVIVTRFGNVYGEGDLHFDRLIPGICKAIVKDEVFEIRSDGTYIRDYLYVKDVVSGYMTVLYHAESINGEAYNFSSEDNLSVLDVIKVSDIVTGKKLHYKIMNTAKNEIPYQHLDDAKIRKLGWASKDSLNSTLHSVLHWYIKMLQ